MYFPSYNFTLWEANILKRLVVVWEETHGYSQVPKGAPVAVGPHASKWLLFSTTVTMKGNCARK